MEETSTLQDNIGTTTTRPLSELIGKLMNTPIDSEDYQDGYFKSDKYRQALERRAEFYNSTPGMLTGYNCPKCNNKGCVMYITDDLVETCKDCECMPIRRCVDAMNRCGIDSKILETNTFDNFEETEDWQKRMKSIVRNYTDAILRGDTEHWLIISGQTGAGKTHLSTAACIEFMKSGLNVKYMTWKDIVHKLQQAKFNSTEYYNIINDISTVDVFYIDDLFKTEKAEKDIAFEVLNTRYVSRKPVVVSTEVNLDGIQNIDAAIAGRISEMCRGYVCQIKNDDNRNYRRKK